MVFFVLTRSAYEELREIMRSVPSPLWVAGNVLSDAEVKELRSAGVNVTSFSNPIGSRDTAAIEGALNMIGRHHPGETIWVQRDVERET